ncbi:hypothetical protein UlMin_003544 [Ulmus minor]
MAEIAQSIVEQREELMVSTNGAPKPISRTAHFLKSPQNSIHQPSPQLSSQSLPKNLSLNGIFCGWRSPPKNWKPWVDLLMPKYESLWKKAGIFEAIRISTFQVPKNDILLLSISEKWNSESKSFLFPWGEATITLEDVMVLGGYSVLGSSVISPPESSEMVEMEEKLKKARSELVRGTCRKASQGAWVQLFIGSGKDFEHEAFLAAWLSRFVLPDSLLIRKAVFPIAVRLARGIRIALAPAVLSSIYKDLGSLKTCNGDDSVIKLWSPFQLVHLWILGRFSALQPEDNAAVFSGWQKVEKRRLESIRQALDSDGKKFLWRPYVRNCATFGLARFYGEEEMLVSISLGLDEKTESFARCLRVSQLVGLDSVEEYLPHRVARQFGFDQDVPGCLVQSDRSPKVAWEDYSKPFGCEKLYIPSRHFEGEVTIKYLKWRKSPLLDSIELSTAASQQVEKFKMPKPIPEASIVNIEEEEEEEPRDVTPGFSPEQNSAKEKNHVKPTSGSNVIATDWMKGIEESEKNNHADVPPGFSPKHNLVGANFCVRKSAKKSSPSKPTIVGLKRSMAEENEGSGGNMDQSSKEENRRKKKPNNNEQSQTMLVAENVEPALPANDRVKENGKQGGAGSDEVMLPGVAELHAQIDKVFAMLAEIKRVRRLKNRNRNLNA